MKRIVFYASVIAISAILLAASAVYQIGLFSGGGFICSQDSPKRPNYVTNGDFQKGFLDWSLTGPNATALVTTQDSHCGSPAAELITVQAENSTGISLLQDMNYSGCHPPVGHDFGLAMNKGLELSLWHRTLNVSTTRFGVVVTFHNGTSKLTIDYLLAYRGTPEPNAIDKNLGAGFVEDTINSSNNVWQQSTFNLTRDFVRFFGVDPVARLYCVNYVGIWQLPIVADHQGNGSTTTNLPEGRSFCYLTDLVLRAAAAG
jgi:hypothetical protein